MSYRIKYNDSNCYTSSHCPNGQTGPAGPIGPM